MRGMNFESLTTELLIEDGINPGAERASPLATTNNTNLPRGRAWASHNSPHMQEVEPVSNSTIQARDNIVIAFWNSRGIGNKHSIKHRLLSDLDASVILLNEQWKSFYTADFKIEEKRDMATIEKYNTSTWVKTGIQYKRHINLETQNTIILHLEHIKLWTICFYMRPRESAGNEEILKNLSNSITKITIDHPEDTILVCGDLNREDALAEVYLEPLVEKIKLEPNHLTKTDNTEN